MKAVQARQVKRIRINYIFRAWLEAIGTKEAIKCLDFLDKGKILIIGSFDEEGNVQNVYIERVSPTIEVPNCFFDMIKRFTKEFSLLKKKVIAIFYNGSYHDCFTVVLNERRVEPNRQVLYTCLGLNREGGWYHTDVVYSEDGDNSHLGKEISFEDLPIKALKTVFMLYPFKEKEEEEDEKGVKKVGVEEEVVKGKEERGKRGKRGERRKKRRGI